MPDCATQEEALH